MQSLRLSIISAIAVIGLGLGLTAPAAAAPEEDGILRIGGSTTLLPIISKAASDFMEIHGTWDKVDPSLPKKDVVIFVSGGGSGFGMKSVINGTVHIGLASRKIKEKEKKLLGEHAAFLVGKDAVVIAANKNNPLAKAKDSFTKDEVAEIFSAEKRSFKDIDSTMPDKEIVLFVRDSGAGSAEMMQKLILRKRQVSSGALQLPSQGTLLRKLETNTQALGYISSGLAFSSNKLHAFALEGVVPTNDNVINGKYMFVRPLLMVVKGKPGPMVRHFIDYVLTKGQETVIANNYVPAGKALTAHRK
jgi:phosphate transport system substrate-binding protein